MVWPLRIRMVIPEEDSVSVVWDEVKPGGVAADVPAGGFEGLRVGCAVALTEADVAEAPVEPPVDVAKPGAVGGGVEGCVCVPLALGSALAPRVAAWPAEGVPQAALDSSSDRLRSTIWRCLM